MPANTETLNAKHNQELKNTLEELNQKNIEIDSLNQKMEEAKSAQSKAEENLKTLQNSSGGTLAQYQNLVKILPRHTGMRIRKRLPFFMWILTGPS